MLVNTSYILVKFFYFSERNLKSMFLQTRGGSMHAMEKRSAPFRTKKNESATSFEPKFHSLVF